jgi:hypothetical protein
MKNIDDESGLFLKPIHKYLLAKETTQTMEPSDIPNQSSTSPLLKLKENKMGTKYQT